MTRNAGELGPQERGIEPHRLHQLGPAVGRGRGHPHHRHRLHETRAQALQVGLFVLGGGLDPEPGADRVRAHRDEEGAVVHVPDAEVGDEAQLVPEAGLHDRVVEAGDEAQARQRRPLRVHRPVGKDEHRGLAPLDEGRFNGGGEGALQALGSLRRGEGRVEDGHALLAPQPAQLARGQDALGEDVERPLSFVPEARPVAERHRRLEDPRVPDRVDGGRGLLGEAQLEVVVEPPRMVVEERGGRRVVAHRPHRELPALEERSQDDVLVLLRHAEGDLQPAQLGGGLDRASAGLAFDPPLRHREALAGHLLPHVLGEQHLAAWRAARSRCPRVRRSAASRPCRGRRCP